MNNLEEYNSKKELNNGEWEKQEQIDLILAIQNNMPIEEIALKHKRSVSSIDNMIQKLVYKNKTENGHNFHDISKQFNMSIEEVLNKYNTYKKTREKNEGTNIENVEKKLEILERENRLIKTVLENNELHRKLNEEINNKRINKNIKSIIKSLRKK
jgi:transposase